MMTTTSKFSRKERSDSMKLYLLMLLLGLLTLFFAIGIPGKKNDYAAQSLQGNEVTTNNKIKKANPATMYEAIVSNGDAIRSVLQ